MSEALNDAALKQLFFDARTFNKFQPRPIDDATLHSLVDLMKWGPTSMNTQPARIVFVRSAAANTLRRPPDSALTSTVGPWLRSRVQRSRGTDWRMRAILAPPAPACVRPGR